MSALKFPRAARFCLIHGAVVLALLFLLFVYKCPFSYFLHIPCPGCGVTRAHLAALRLDFKAAFAYHPLFFTVAPTVLYTAHRNVLKARLKPRAELIAYGVLLALFVVVYIVRLLSGRIAV